MHKMIVFYIMLTNVSNLSTKKKKSGKNVGAIFKHKTSWNIKEKEGK